MKKIESKIKDFREKFTCKDNGINAVGKQFGDKALVWKAEVIENWLRENLESEKVCEHNLISFNYVGTWSSSEPPPNMKCTKCLQEFRF